MLWYYRGTCVNTLPRARQPGHEPTTCWSQVQRPTTTPPSTPLGRCQIILLGDRGTCVDDLPRVRVAAQKRDIREGGVGNYWRVSWMMPVIGHDSVSHSHGCRCNGNDASQQETRKCRYCDFYGAASVARPCSCRWSNRIRCAVFIFIV